MITVYVHARKDASFKIEQSAALPREFWLDIRSDEDGSEVSVFLTPESGRAMLAALAGFMDAGVEVDLEALLVEPPEKETV